MLLIYYQICFLFKYLDFHVMHSLSSVLCVDFLSSAYLLLCFFKKRIFFYNCSIKTKIPIDKPSYTNKTPNLKVFFYFLPCQINCIYLILPHHMSEKNELLTGLQSLKTKLNNKTSTNESTPNILSSEDLESNTIKRVKLNDGSSKSKIPTLSFQAKLEESEAAQVDDNGEPIDNSHLNTNILLTSEYLKQIHDNDANMVVSFKDIIQHLKINKNEYWGLYNTLIVGTDKIRCILGVSEGNSVEINESLEKKLATERTDPIYKRFPGFFMYNAIYKINNSKDLLKYLDSQSTYKGMPVKDLKDGWPKCNIAINELEMTGKLIVLRTKKDNTPRYIWRNNFRFNNRIKEQIMADYERQKEDSKQRRIEENSAQNGQNGKFRNLNRREKVRTSPFQLFVDEEFIDMWEDTKLPSRQEIPRRLEDLGLKPASIDPSTIIKKGTITKVDVKKKRSRRSKITNTHMAGLLKDYNT